MHQSGADMREGTFNLIPAREQPKHEYLKKAAKAKKENSLEDQ